MLRRLSHSTPLTLQLLLLAALLMRGLLPMGYMPGSVGGEAGLVYCTPQGASQNLTSDASPAQASAHHQTICPFALSLGMAALQLDHPSSAEWAASAPVAALATASTFSAPLAGPHSARGPPEKFLI